MRTYSAIFYNCLVYFIFFIYPTLAQQDCWWTGCQLKTWEVIGCEQYDRIEAQNQSCNSGYKYKCCKEAESSPPSTHSDELNTACGRPTENLELTKISNGTSARIQNFPWIVGVYFESIAQSGTNIFRFLCGGSLISRNIVLTAAHCFFEDFKRVPLDIVPVDPERIQIALGKTYYPLYDKRDAAFFKKFQITKYVIHPNYAGKKNHYYDDIAIAYLAGNVEFNSAIQPICLNFAMEDENKMKIGDSGLIAGWGKVKREYVNVAQELLYAAMEYVALDNCGKTEATGQMCASYKKKDQTICNGDSGSSFVYKDSKTGLFYLKGIGSRNVMCDGKALLTDVNKYQDFIKTLNIL